MARNLLWTSGPTGSWNTSANWRDLATGDPAISLPGGNDVVNFNGSTGSAALCDVNGITALCKQLMMTADYTGPLRLRNAATLTISGTDVSVVDGGGGITCIGFFANVVNVAGGLTYKAATLGAQTSGDNAMTLNLTGGASVFKRAGTISIGATITLSGAATLSLSNIIVTAVGVGSSLNNAATCTLTVDATMSGIPIFNPAGTTVLTGTCNLDADSPITGTGGTVQGPADDTVATIGSMTLTQTALVLGSTVAPPTRQVVLLRDEQGIIFAEAAWTFLPLGGIIARGAVVMAHCDMTVTVDGSRLEASSSLIANSVALDYCTLTVFTRCGPVSDPALSVPSPDTDAAPTLASVCSGFHEYLIVNSLNGTLIGDFALPYTSTWPIAALNPPWTYQNNGRLIYLTGIRRENPPAVYALR